MKKILKKTKKLFGCVKTVIKKTFNCAKVVGKFLFNCLKVVGKFLLNCAKTVIGAPHAICIFYRQGIAKDVEKNNTSACRILEEYATEVLGTQISEDNFDYVKFMYLKYRDHRSDIKEVVVTAIETFFSFLTTYIYIVFSKDAIWKGFAEEALSFVVFYLVAFYIPGQLKIRLNKMSKKNRAIKDMTYKLYCRLK